MTTEQIIGLVLALLVMLVGLAGSVLPMLPSMPLVLIAAIGHRLYFHEASASWPVLAILGGLTLLSLVLDQVASAYGAKRLGGSWRGVLGAIIGGLVGLFFALPGILLGPFIGAILFELVGGRGWKDSSRAGVGATLGLLVSAVGKLACCAAMIALFAFDVLRRSLP